MDFDINSLAIGTTLGVVLGYLGRTLIDHFLAKSRSDELRVKTEFDEAARQFRSVVAKEIAELQIQKPTNLGALYAALIEFEPHLSPVKQRELTEVWEQYKKYEQMRTTIGVGMTDVKKLLNELLSFTK